MGDKIIRVAVGLSGGVDSSVAAALLKEEGYDVIGLSMEIFDGPAGMEQPERHACYGPNEREDIERAAAVCKKLDVPFLTIDLKKEYGDHVIKYFRDEYLAGRTPNPCIVCNARLKFGFLLEKARESGIDFDLFATGHYARVEKSGGRPVLKKALDVSKDQSYFLYALSPLQLSRTLFPIGPYKNISPSIVMMPLGRRKFEYVNVIPCHYIFLNPPCLNFYRRYRLEPQNFIFPCPCLVYTLELNRYSKSQSRPF